MSVWTGILVLAACALAFKAVGPLVVGERRLPPAVVAAVSAFPVPMLAALVVVGTVATGTSLTVDARLPAVLVAGVLAWRRAPFLVVIGAAALTAALLRLAV